MDTLSSVFALIFQAFGLFLKLIVDIFSAFILIAQSILHALHLG